MGWIDFVKEAGESLLSFGGPEEAKAEVPEPQRRSANNEALLKNIADLGLQVEGLEISSEGDDAIVSGKALSQAEREKVVVAVGNTQGIARVDDQIQVEAPEPESVVYTVKKGDTLSKIAKTHYGDAMRYPEIFEANRPMLKDPDLIYPGQVLRIPQQA